MARRWPRSSRSRADDPIYEIGFRIVGSTEQERIWTHVLKSLAAHFGVNEPVTLEKVLVDPKVQWSRAGDAREGLGRPESPVVASQKCLAQRWDPCSTRW